MNDTTNLIALVVVVGLVLAFVAWTRAHPLAPPTPMPSAAVVPPGRPLSFVRVYRGHDQASAVRVMQGEAELLAREGYVISSQSWAPGSYGCGAFLVALILFVVLIGILVFVYMLLVKPPGTLSVTYSLQPGQPSPPPSAMDDLAKLAALRDSGVLTPAEFEAKKAEILRRI